jgi:serine/threonine protein kinase
MGMVYRAEQTAIWRPVALKVLRSSHSQDKNHLERFRIEAATASKLTHPNTITIYDFGSIDNFGFYIAMEMLEGKNLDQETCNEKALDWRRACRIALQICGSLQEAHDCSIIHRDLKPENIMLVKRGGESDVVKVLDFGIAKIMTKEGSASGPALTAGNEIFGTPEYMSPEQIRGDALDNRSDIYSLGVILYRILSGVQPFDAPSPIAILTKHLTAAPPPLEVPKGMRKIPSELAALVVSCLSKKVSDRPNSMRRIAEILLTVLDETAPVALFKHSRFEPENTNDKDRSHSRSVEKPKATAIVTREEIAKAGKQPVPAAPFINKEAGGIAVGEDDHDSDEGLPAMHPSLSTELDDEKIETGKNLREATLTSLQNKMKKYRDFPAMSRSIVELNSQSLRGDISAGALSNVIVKDYALTGKLLRLVNSPMYTQYRGKVMTVSRAVVIMGFEQVRQISLGLMMFNRIEKTDPKLARVLKDETLFSLTSGLVSKRLAEKAGDMDPETAFICGMFHRLGKYIAYYYFPTKGKEIRRFIKLGKMDDNAAALKVLGISFSDLGKWMVDAWSLPEQFAAAMDSLSSGQPDRPKSAAEKLRLVVGFADELVTCAGRNHKGDRKTDLKALARRFEKVLQMEDDQLAEVMAQSANEVKDWAKVLSIDVDDSRFISQLFNWSGIAEVPDVPDERFSDAPDGAAAVGRMSTVPGEEVDALTEKKRIFEQGIEEVTLTMTDRYDLNSLILMVLETIYRGLALSRVVFFFNDVKTASMIARSGFGDDIEDLFPKLRFQPARGRDYFTQAVTMGKDVVLYDTTIPRVQEHLPVWYRRVLDAPSFILYPVMLRNIAVGLIYGDLDNPNCRINNGLLVNVDKLRNLTGRAIREKRVLDR